MAGVVQWTVDEFWGQLQNLKTQIDQVSVGLNNDKAQLTALYNTARQQMDPSRDVFLAPLIHQNTVLRLQYLQPVKDKYMGAVNAAAGVLRSAGYTVPTLSGVGEVGFAPLVVPVVAAAAVLVALAAVVIVWRMTQSQITRTNSMATMFADTTTTPAQKIALSQAQSAAIVQENKATPPPLGFDFGTLVPLAAIIAVILLGPQILKMLPAGRSRATA